MPSLNAVIGYSEIVRDGAMDENRQQYVQDLDRVLGAARCLLQLVASMVDFSKTKAKKLDLPIAPASLCALAQEAGDAVGPLAEAKGDIVGVRIAPDADQITTDGLRVSQCLLNLLSNAVKFTKNRAITVDIARDGDLIRIDLADTGIGISAQQMQRRFFALFAGP